MKIAATDRGQRHASAASEQGIDEPTSATGRLPHGRRHAKRARLLQRPDATNFSSSKLRDQGLTPSGSNREPVERQIQEMSGGLRRFLPQIGL